MSRAVYVYNILGYTFVYCKQVNTQAGGLILVPGQCVVSMYCDGPIIDMVYDG